MSEFSEEMDDLFFWLDEVDALLNTGVRPADRDFLQQLSDKLKVDLNVRLTELSLLQMVAHWSAGRRQQRKFNLFKKFSVPF